MMAARYTIRCFTILGGQSERYVLRTDRSVRGFFSNMVEPRGIEPQPSDFQSDEHTTYTKVPKMLAIFMMQNYYDLLHKNGASYIKISFIIKKLAH